MYVYVIYIKVYSVIICEPMYTLIGNMCILHICLTIVLSNYLTSTDLEWRLSWNLQTKMQNLALSLFGL